MGRRKNNDEKSAKQIRGPGRKAKKQGEPTFPKELLDTGRKKFFFHPHCSIELFIFRCQREENII